MLQGRLDAVQATNETLQEQLAARREVDNRALAGCGAGGGGPVGGVMGLAGRQVGR